MCAGSSGGQSDQVAATNNKASIHNYTHRISRTEVVDKLLSLGFEYVDRIPETGSVRFPARGKQPDNRSAWAKYSDDGTACHWYDWPSGEGGTIFRAFQSSSAPTDHTNNKLSSRVRTAKFSAERECLHRHVAKRAQTLYQNAKAVGTHPYIERKRLASLQNARLELLTGALLVPMRVSGGELVNLQRIYANGRKRFLKGGRVKGAYSAIGGLNDTECVLVVEGWATGVTLFELYGHPVVVAFNAGNLMTVCQSLRSSFPETSLIVAGDDDRQNVINTGRLRAMQAAVATSATLVFPELCKCCTCTDFNDAAVCGWRCNRG